MPKAKRHPDRRTVSELVGDLREEAIDLATDLEGIEAHETVGAEAAQALEEFEAALTWIASGVEDPKVIAAQALVLAAPLTPLASSDQDDPIRRMLKPRRS
jgi:hypothetical protein